MSELKLDVPPELLSILRELGEPSETVKECVVLELYRRGVISSGKAAELLGMTRWEFRDFPEPSLASVAKGVPSRSTISRLCLATEIG